MDEYGRHPMAQWLETATRGIRFGPDRKAVEAELRAHIEDKTLDYQRIFPGMDWEEARERALSEMGDPAEIGKELARVHRPWLGWLWTVSRWMVRLALLVPLLAIFLRVTEGGLGGWYTRRDVLGRQADCVELVPPEQAAQVCGEEVSVARAVYGPDGERKRLGAQLRVTSPAFWRDRGTALRHYTCAVDDLGNRYPAWQTYYQAMKEGGSDGSRAYTDGTWGTRTPFYQEYELWVYGLDPEAEWVRLEYDHMGQRFDLTIEIKEAEA